MSSFTQPAPGEVQLWSWSLRVEESTAESLKKFLSPDEILLADKYATHRLKVRYLAGRGGLRQILGAVLGQPAASLRFCYEAAGKPQLVDYPSLHFNLAHSADEALLAIAKQPVGIDLEKLREIQNQAELVRRWFSESEVAQYESLNDVSKREFFFRLWTGKEAVIKLFGGSIGEGLRDIEPPIDTDQGETSLPKKSSFHERNCWITRLDIGMEWAAAIATLGQPTRGESPCRITLPLQVH